MLSRLELRLVLVLLLVGHLRQRIHVFRRFPRCHYLVVGKERAGQTDR